jgi:hypothetical protein
LFVAKESFHMLRTRAGSIRDILAAFFNIRHIGASSSGKTQDFGSCIRRFESSRPSQETICHRSRGAKDLTAVIKYKQIEKSHA